MMDIEMRFRNMSDQDREKLKANLGKIADFMAEKIAGMEMFEYSKRFGPSDDWYGHKYGITVKSQPGGPAVYGHSELLYASFGKHKDSSIKDQWWINAWDTAYGLLLLEMWPQIKDDFLEYVNDRNEMSGMLDRFEV